MYVFFLCFFLFNKTSSGNPDLPEVHRNYIEKINVATAS